MAAVSGDLLTATLSPATVPPDAIRPLEGTIVLQLAPLVGMDRGVTDCVESVSRTVARRTAPATEACASPVSGALSVRQCVQITNMETTAKKTAGSAPHVQMAAATPPLESAWVPVRKAIPVPNVNNYVMRLATVPCRAATVLEEPPTATRRQEHVTMGPVSWDGTV